MVKEKDFRMHCVQYNIPLISETTETFLKLWIREHQPYHIAEIGSAIGYSTSMIAESMQTYTQYGSIDSREISYPHYRQSIENTRRYQQVKVYLGNINHIPLERYNNQNQYNLLFIDGRKSETLDYMRQWIPYMQVLGTIIVDDVIKFKEKMRNLYLFLDKNNIKYTIHQLDKDDGILILTITPHLIQALSLLSDHS